jgi:putative transposase
MRMLRSISVTGQISVESSALFVNTRPLVGTGDSSDDGLTHHLERADKSSACAGTARGGKNNSRTSENENLGKGSS